MSSYSKDEGETSGMFLKPHCLRKGPGPPGAITWAPRGNHVGPLGQSLGPPGEITWATWGNHLGPQGKSRG